jgi:anti-sigma B factor antagonist
LRFERSGTEEPREAVAKSLGLSIRRHTVITITTRNIGTCAVLDCIGQITIGPGALSLRNAVREATRSGIRRVVLNLQDVDYSDSTGIGELVASLTHLQGLGGTFALVKVPKRIVTLLNITQLTAAFEIYDDEQAALAGRQ